LTFGLETYRSRKLENGKKNFTFFAILKFNLKTLEVIECEKIILENKRKNAKFLQFEIKLNIIEFEDNF
jgi:hypothetical protein